jgi:TonB family protein
MLLDFEDYRPETPRITFPISIREGVLLSLVVHLLFVIALLLAPDAFFGPSPVQTAALLQPQDREPLRFIEVVPLEERPAPPRLPADQSDLDRRSFTIERAPVPENARPFSRGDTPETVVGGPTEPLVAAGSPAPTPDPADLIPQPPLPGMTTDGPSIPVERPPNRPGSLGDAFQNLEQYLAQENHENSQGGLTEQAADIQFDSKGIDFGPWLRRFKNQVERNWIVPPAAMSLKGRVVIQFYVLRNGTIVGLQVLQEGPVAALTASALNALKLSNPTAVLPPDFPDDRVLFTVTFHYNEFFR